MSAERIAVLVDGDNISATHSASILSHARKMGRVDVARVYGGAQHSCDWQSAPGYRLMHAGAGKNAADVLLCIDAMELALTGGLQTFAVATSDGDFTHLSQRLRERGLHVLGLGEEKAPVNFRQACSDFVVLGEEKKAARNPTIRNYTVLDFNVRKMIANHSKEGRGMPIADLGRMMHIKHGTQIRTYSEGTWRAYLDKRSTLYDLDDRGPAAMVRFRPEGFATS